MFSGLLALANNSARAQMANPKSKMTVTLATATPGGGFPVFGDAFIGAITTVDPSITIVPRNTKGSAENIPLLDREDVDLGLVQGEAAYEALNGIGGARVSLPIFSAIYSSPGMFVVKADTPYRTIADLKGKPIAFGAAGSGLVLLARYVLDGLGMSQSQDFQAIYLERAGDGPAMVADGRVAALWGGGIGWPGFQTVTSAPGGARFIVPSASEIQRIQGKHGFLKTLTVPANTYPNQPEPLVSLGSWSFVMARRGLDPEVAYRLAKALYAAEAEIAKRLPAARETTARNTAAALPNGAALHPGVQKLYRELGISN